MEVLTMKTARIEIDEDINRYLDAYCLLRKERVDKKEVLSNIVKEKLSDFIKLIDGLKFK